MESASTINRKDNPAHKMWVNINHAEGVAHTRSGHNLNDKDVKLAVRTYDKQL